MVEPFSDSPHLTEQNRKRANRQTKESELNIMSRESEVVGPTFPFGENEMASQNVLEFGTDNWQSEVVTSGVPVLVDFWAPWCGPCRALTPIIDRVADRFAGKVKVGKVNVDENSDLATQYNITTIPRLMIFKGSDQPLQTIAGLASEAELVSLLTKAIAE